MEYHMQFFLYDNLEIDTSNSDVVVLSNPYGGVRSIQIKGIMWTGYTHIRGTFTFQIDNAHLARYWDGLSEHEGKWHTIYSSKSVKGLDVYQKPSKMAKLLEATLRK